MFDYSDNLIHVATLQKTTNVSTTTNIFGDMVDVTTTTTFSCFAFQDDLVLTSDVGESLRVRAWQVLIPETLDSIIAEDKISQIVDIDGNIIVSNMRVREMARYRHWADSQKANLLILKPN